ncbi:MAG TPA: hypothetical protein VFL91_21310 [Thermomicrobiales bacterium]|nr:hypothetical protein [Thermomicrobiales bacterium]
MRSYEETDAYLDEHPEVLAIWWHLAEIDAAAVRATWRETTYTPVWLGGYAGAGRQPAPHLRAETAHGDFCPLGMWLMHAAGAPRDESPCGADFAEAMTYYDDRNATLTIAWDEWVDLATEFYRAFDEEELEPRAVVERLEALGMLAEEI